MGGAIDVQPIISGLIFGDERSWQPCVEFVAEADLHLVFSQMMTRSGLEHRRRNGHTGERKVRVTAEIGIAIFRPHRPIVGDGIFEAAADDPAPRADPLVLPLKLVPSIVPSRPATHWLICRS
jgi:hypothetical protein